MTGTETPRRRALAAAAAAAALVLAACSSTGGKQNADKSNAPAGGKASTSRITIAMITHSAPGDTFWDIIRKGATAAAQKDNVDFQYSSDADATKQAQLIQAAIDRHVDGIALTDPNTPALAGVIKKAVAAGIPVSMFNAGGADAIDLGAIGYFGQSETDAGVETGKKIAAAGGKKILCVIHTQGQQQLLDRCNGLKTGATGATVETMYVNGTDDSAVETGIQAKLAQDKSIDWVVALGAPIALDAVKSVKGAGSSAKIGTFDTNAALVEAIQNGSISFAIDQQPYLQGYLAVDSIWLYINNGDTLGGGQNVATGPAFIDSSNIAKVAKYAANGTR